MLKKRSDLVKELEDEVKESYITLRRHFFTRIYKHLPNWQDRILFFKKILNQMGFDPAMVDEINYLSPGSGLFLIELYARLLENTTDVNVLRRFYKTVMEIEQKNLEETVGEPELLINLWEHQEEAINAWFDNGCRGLIEMATATGKTLVGLAAALRLYRRMGRLKVLVLTHSRTILNQWRREAIEKLGFLGDLTADYKTPLKYREFEIYFETLQKVHRNPHAYSADLLIVDEVHHSAAKEFRKALVIPAKWKMGLSATIEGAERLYQLEKTLGPKVYTLSLKEALKRKIIPQFDWYVHVTYLSIDEMKEFQEITKRILGLFTFISENHGDLIKKISNGRMEELETLSDFVCLYEIARYRYEMPEEWKMLWILIQQRRRLLYRSRPRLERAMEIAKVEARERKCVIFTMDIETCEKAAELLGSINTFVVHSGIEDGEIKLRLKKFTESPNGALIGARMLDEGIDIPDAEVGINVSASKTRLQLVQRIGRILRKKPGKRPVFHHFVAIPDGKLFIEQEDGLNYADELSWIMDTALRMGVEVKVCSDTEEITELRRKSEKFAGRLFVKKRKIITGSYGTIKMDRILSELEDPVKTELIDMLDSESCPISDERWLELLRKAYRKVSGSAEEVLNLNLSATWWLLVAGERDPRIIRELIARSLA